MRSRIIALFVLVVAASACGSKTQTTTAAVSSPASTAGATTVTNAASTSAPATTVPSATTQPVTPAAAGNATGADFCGYWNAVVDATGVISYAIPDNSSTPAQVRSSIADLKARITALDANPPAEIKDDIATTKASYKDVEAAYAAYSYDVAKIRANPTAFDAARDAITEKYHSRDVGKRLAAYHKQNCP